MNGTGPEHSPEMSVETSTLMMTHCEMMPIAPNSDKPVIVRGLNRTCNQIAVEFRNVELSHVTQPDTQINLTVSQNSIYAIVGSSGSGKSLALKAMAGVAKPKNGFIKLFGKSSEKFNKDSIGYMPETLALHPELTPDEVISFFGQLLGLDAATLESRRKYLSYTLNLQTKMKTQIHNLSFSERRRVSLIVSVINHPKLLILDEPTLGSDLYARRDIWNLLIELKTEEGMTIVLSTSHIKDVEMADLVGLITNNSLLEASPQQISGLNEGSIEKCLLNFSRSGNAIERFLPELPIETINEHSKPKGYPHHLKNECKRCATVLNIADKYWIQTIALIWRNFLSLKRRPFNVFIQLAAPLAIFLGLLLCVSTNMSGMLFGVVNDEPEPLWGKLFLDTVDKRAVTLIEFNDTASAFEAVARGDIIGVIYLGPDFSNSLMERLEMPLMATLETVNKSVVKVYMDASNQLLLMFAKKVLYETFPIFSKKLLEAAFLNPGAEQLPVKFEKPLFGFDGVNFLKLLLPGLLILVPCVMGITATISIQVEERKLGIVERTLRTGTSSFLIMSSHLMSHFTLIAFQSASMLICAYFLYGYQINTPSTWVVVTVIMLIQGIYGLSFGLLMSSLFNSTNIAFLLSLGLLAGTSLLSGTFWPLEGQTQTMRLISQFFPQTFPVYALSIVQFKYLNLQTICGSTLIPLGWTLTNIIMSSVITIFRK